MKLINKKYFNFRIYFLGTKSHCETEYTFRKNAMNEDDVDDSDGSMIIFILKRFCFLC